MAEHAVECSVDEDGDNSIADETEKLCPPAKTEESDYDNLESEDEAVYETISLLNESTNGNNANGNIGRPLSLNIQRLRDEDFSPLSGPIRHSVCAFPTNPENHATDPGAIVVHVTGGNDEQERSWSKLKSTSLKSKLSSNRNSRAEESPPLTPADAVRALASERIRNISGQHQQAESPFRYKNWILHLARRRRCEILILIGLLLWLTFFFVLAIVLNGNSSKDEPSTTSDVIGLGTNGAKNGSVRNVLPPPVSIGDSEQPTQPGIYPRASTVNNAIMTQPVTSSYNLYTPTSSNNIDSDVAITTVEGGKPEITRTKVQMNTTIIPTTDDVTSHTTVDQKSRDREQSSENYVIIGDTTVSNSKLTTIETNDTAQSNEILVVVPDIEKVSSPNEEILESIGTADSEDLGEIRYPNTTVPVNITDILEGKSPNYLIGVGRADITGPAADVNMMGYANPSQTSGGIHMRQYARAFILQDPKSTIRTVYVNIDACMSSTLVKLEVLKVLKTTYGDLYTSENLCISGTHTHSAPAGFLQDVLFQISSWGFVGETLTAMVNGIVESIQRAHDTVQPAYILLNKGQLLNSNINRSPMAYLNNPVNERQRYPYDVDKDMTLLKFLDKNGNGMGMINWFPVHCTSMNNTNSLISGDNKGYAELLFEEYMDPGSLPGTSKFVAAFAQSNEGDVSPNTKGPHCSDTGVPCDNIDSTCNGKVQNCIASGPGKDMFESTKIIGNNQYKKAKELYESALVLIDGSVKVVHQFVDMTEYEVVVNKSDKVKLCKPAMGFSFAAGTTDGPGAFDFKQGDKSGKNAFWQAIRNFLHPPSEEQKKCHSPKPILLDTGEMTSPYEWQPNIVETQLLRIGQFILIAVPGEFSTMAGRRVRNSVLKTFFKSDRETRFEAVIAGLANTYSDYITTFEEYQVQRYEGASTIYGPYTEMAYIQQYKYLAASMIKGEKPSNDVHPPNNKDVLYSFVPGVYFDASYTYSMGDVIDDVKANYTAGEEVVVKFVAGNPRNSLQMQPNMTFLVVQRELSDGSWKIVHTDASWETKFIWKRTSTLKAQSEVTIIWETDSRTEPGIYRIAHKGHYKSLWGGGIYSYSGQSSNFRIDSNT